jgi:hypothetical protein
MQEGNIKKIIRLTFGIIFLVCGLLIIAGAVIHVSDIVTGSGYCYRSRFQNLRCYSWHENYIVLLLQVVVSLIFLAMGIILSFLSILYFTLVKQNQYPQPISQHVNTDGGKTKWTRFNFREQQRAET